MATRLFQLGFELGILECNAFNVSGQPCSVGSAKAKTGTLGLNMNSATNQPLQGGGRGIPNTTELRAYCAINHNNANVGGAAVDQQAYLIQLVKADGTIWRFGWHHGNALFYITSTTTTVLASATDVGTNFGTINTWNSVSIAAKVHASAGWLNLYINGILIASYTGATGASPITQVLFGGTPTGGGTWSATTTFDDCYCDDTTGEAAAPSAERKFIYLAANGNGASSQWTGTDGDSTNNFQNVDDVGVNDGDTTENHAGVVDLVDSYPHATYTTPINYSPVAVINTVVARKTNAAVDTQLQLRLHKGASDTLATAIALSTSYAVYEQRATALPDASTLNDANINLTEVGVVSKGSF